MTAAIRQFINSVPDKRVALQLLGALDRMLPTNKDIAITAYATGGQANATVLKSSCSFHDVATVATAADSVVLPAAKEGEYHFVKNSGANTMQVYAPDPDTIDSVATGTGVSQLAGDAVLYACLTDGNYIRCGGVQATEAFTAITTGSITGSDSSLGIDGQAAAQGGAIVVTGGTSSTAGNAGGAASVTGGTPGSTGIGGAVNLIGGAGGSASGAGGKATVKGGAATAGATAGGAVDVIGGASTGSGTGGVVTVTGGAGSAATGVGGALTMAGGAGNTTGAGGNVSLTGGAGGNDAVGGSATLKGGAAGGGNRAGGEALVTGGAGAGTQAGGAITAAAGAGGATGAGGAVTLTSGAGGATSGVSGDLTIATGTTTAGAGSATGQVIVQSGAGSGSAAAVAAGASGAVTMRSQAGGANTGAASGQVGGAAGAVAITGGAGGATDSQGAHAGGAGASVTVTAGAGGNATAGTGNGGRGGSVILAHGTGGTSSGGTAGLGGGIFQRSASGAIFRQQPAQVDKADGAESVTAAQMFSGIVVFTVTTGRTLTTPTGAAISAACPPDLAVGDSFDFTVITLGAGADDIATLTAGDGNVTFVGNVTIGPEGSTFNNYGTFRFRNTGANTWVGYRIG